MCSSQVWRGSLIFSGAFGYWPLVLQLWLLTENKSEKHLQALVLVREELWNRCTQGWAGTPPRSVDLFLFISIWLQSLPTAGTGARPSAPRPAWMRAACSRASRPRPPPLSSSSRGWPGSPRAPSRPLPSPRGWCWARRPEGPRCSSRCRPRGRRAPAALRGPRSTIGPRPITSTTGTTAAPRCCTWPGTGTATPRRAPRNRPAPRPRLCPSWKLWSVGCRRGFPSSWSSWPKFVSSTSLVSVHQSFFWVVVWVWLGNFIRLWCLMHPSFLNCDERVVGRLYQALMSDTFVHVTVSRWSLAWKAWDNACDKFTLLSVQVVFIQVRSICFLSWPVLFLFLISPWPSYEAEDGTKASPSELSLGEMGRAYIDDSRDFLVAQKGSEGWDSCLAGGMMVVKSS